MPPKRKREGPSVVTRSKRQRTATKKIQIVEDDEADQIAKSLTEEEIAVEETEEQKEEAEEEKEEFLELDFSRKKVNSGFVDNKECEDDQVVIIGCGPNSNNVLALTPQQQKQHGKGSHPAATKLGSRKYQKKQTKRTFIPSLVKDIVTTQHNSIFLTEDGCVWVVGLNTPHSLLGIKGKSCSVPRLLPFSATTPVDSMHMGADMTLYYICESGAIYHTGTNVPTILQRFKLISTDSEDDDEDSSTLIRQLSFRDLIPEKIINVAFGAHSALILTSAGHLFLLPDDGYSKADVKQLALEETKEGKVIQADVNTIKKMAVVNNQFLILLQDGTLFHWDYKSRNYYPKPYKDTVFKDFSVATGYRTGVVYLTESGTIYMSGMNSSLTSVNPSWAQKLDLNFKVFAVSSHIYTTFVLADEQKKLFLVSTYTKQAFPAQSYTYQDLVDINTHELDKIVGAGHFFLVFKHRSQRRKQRLLQMRANLRNCCARLQLTDIGFLFK